MVKNNILLYFPKISDKLEVTDQDLIVTERDFINAIEESFTQK